VDENVTAADCEGSHDCVSELPAQYYADAAALKKYGPGLGASPSEPWLRERGYLSPKQLVNLRGMREYGFMADKFLHKKLATSAAIS
jgi:hypothetical protein